MLPLKQSLLEHMTDLHSGHKVPVHKIVSYVDFCFILSIQVSVALFLCTIFRRDLFHGYIREVWRQELSCCKSISMLTDSVKEGLDIDLL
jgi:hypothetical protein